MFQKKVNIKTNKCKPFLLLFLFLLSCFLQVSITLKNAELAHYGDSKVTKGAKFEMPDTPENPEKNNCDYFEEDNENEVTKLEGDYYNNWFCFSSRIKIKLRLLNKKDWNSTVLHSIENIYLSVCNLRI